MAAATDRRGGQDFNPGRRGMFGVARFSCRRRRE